MATTYAITAPVWERGLDSTRVAFGGGAYLKTRRDNVPTMSAGTTSPLNPRRSRSLPCLFEYFHGIHGDFGNDILQKQEEKPKCVEHHSTHAPHRIVKTNKVSTCSSTCTNRHVKGNHFYYRQAARARVLELFQDASFSTFLPSSSRKRCRSTSAAVKSIANEDACALLNRSDIRAGKTLGRGGFAEVKELCSVSTQQQ